VENFRGIIRPYVVVVKFPSCDEAIQGLNKKRRLSYHNLKKVMREIHPSCDEAIQGLNKKRRLSYHNLKKVIRERKKNIGGIGNTVVPGSSVNASQTTSNVHKRRMLFNQSEIHPSFHEVILPLNKKRRLSYHNLKKVIRERKKYIATLPSREKLTYHNLKKIVHAQHNRNRYGHISHNGHATVREEKITFRGLEATPCTTTNENQQTLSTHTSLGKKDARQTYMKQIKDTPSIACAICDQLNFTKNTKSFTPDLEAEYLRLTLNDKTFSSGKICLPCKRSLENGKLPQFATPDQIRCNTPLPDVSALTELEERLVSLRIAFAQIRPWGYKRPQMGLTGSIINVPVQLDVVQKSLPQFISDTMTIVVALKRRLQYKNAYQTGKVCVHVVMKALKELCSRALYKAQNICINENWNNVLGEGMTTLHRLSKLLVNLIQVMNQRMKHLLKH
jgi:ribosomal protein L34E